MNIPEIGLGLVELFTGVAALGATGLGVKSLLDSRVDFFERVAVGGMSGITLISGCAAGVIGVQAIAHGFSSVDAPVSHPTQSPSGYSVLKP